MSDSSPDADKTPNPASASPTGEGPKELPNMVSYVVIAAVVAGLGGYAWWSSTHLDDTHVQWNNNGDTVAQDAPMPVGVAWEMEPAKVDLQDIILPGIPRDGIKALTSPKVTPVASANFDDRMRMVGVEIDGQARAYPLNLLLHHEVINDELAGVPIAVTLSPPSETIAVYDRRVGGETIELGVAGRIYFSNSLLFDRRAQEPLESLWRQYDGVAIAGPAAGEDRSLERIDSIVTSWGRYKTLAPDATVLSEDTGHQRDYKINPHAESYTSELTTFPLPAPSGRRPKMKQKAQVVIVATSGGRKGYFLDDLRAIKGQMIEDRVGSATIKIGYPQKGLELEAPDDLVRFQSYWLAVDALDPELDLWSPADDGADSVKVTGGTGASEDTSETGASDELAEAPSPENPSVPD